MPLHLPSFEASPLPIHFPSHPHAQSTTLALQWGVVLTRDNFMIERERER